MIYSHDEVELIDVMTLFEAVSKIAGRGITARMNADCILAVMWFKELADFGEMDGRLFRTDWNWDGPLVMESLASTNEGSLARSIYVARRFTKSHVKKWILSHDSWKVKADG